jgi:hypothetical protein
MDERMNEITRSETEQDCAERSIEEFAKLSGQGDSSGRTFDREEIHQRKISPPASATECPCAE